MFCPNCGKNIAEGARFCPGCGAPIGGAKQPRQQSYRQPQRHVARLGGGASRGGGRSVRTVKKAGGGLLKNLLIGVVALVGVSTAANYIMEHGTDNSRIVGTGNGSSKSAEGVTLALEKTVYAPGERFDVDYAGVSEALADAGAWIGIAGRLEDAEEYLNQEYLSEGRGTVTMRAPAEPGDYEVRFFKSPVAGRESLVSSASLGFTVRVESVPPEIDSGVAYYLWQSYEFPVDEKEGEEEFLLYKAEFDSDEGLAYLYDLSIPDDEVYFFEWNGSSLHFPGSEYAENGGMELQIRDDGVISGYITADGETAYWRLSPVAQMGDEEWITVETEETFETRKEYRLEDGNSRIDDIFMDEVRAFAAAHGLSMTPGSKPEEGDGNGNPLEITNQFTEEQIQYYIQIEGQRHIREYTEWKTDPDGFSHADHMQLPSNAGITQEEFEQRADEYAYRKGPSDYVPIETWKD